MKDLQPPERWRTIKNTDYAVSNYGRVRGPHGNLTPSFARGYEQVGLSLAGRKFQFKVHYLVCLSFQGAKPAGADCVRHLDGNKENNRSTNLRWGTSKENAADTVRHGRQVCGFDHPNVRVSKLAARCIRKRYISHMEGRNKAANGFILGLCDAYPQLTYRTVYKAARGHYDEME